ncbi:Gfo/Idh/MocA family protein [Nocardioides insulae]|uniref:Gfo/Idh/MocA family protein n=1 Tax=Nocardioides insulae TaxID=394734 RepID=UPI00048E221F|nr:Gfo/Idh/MocA family oxidoreductase [Nocardioides insulae]
MPQRLRVGITGCGRIALNHVKALQNNPAVELVAVCDVDPGRAAEFATTFSVPEHYDDLGRMLANAKLDALTVASPHPAHEAAVLAAATAGVHVLCEKPIAITLDEADRMIEAADTAGITFGALFQRRFWEASRAAKLAVTRGDLGTPTLGSMTLRLGRDSAYFNADPWRGTWTADGGGVLINQAIHYIDLLQWIVGCPVVRVTGRIATLKHGADIEVEDTAAATLEFENGALGVVSAATTYSPGLGTQVLVTGTSGATVSVTEFPEGEPAYCDIWTIPGQTTYRLPYGTDVESDPPLSKVHEGLMPYHAQQIDDFIAAVLEGRDPLVTGREARNALAVVLAIYESSRTGMPIELPSV